MPNTGIHVLGAFAHKTVTSIKWLGMNLCAQRHAGIATFEFTL